MTFTSIKLEAKEEEEKKKNQKERRKDERNKNGCLHLQAFCRITNEAQTKYRLFPPYHLSNAVKNRPTSEGIPEPLKTTECQ
jgi:hypothetical protein